MVDYRTLETGKKLMFNITDIGNEIIGFKECEVTSVDTDHAIATTADGITLWIDEDTQCQFDRVLEISYVKTPDWD